MFRRSSKRSPEALFSADGQEYLRLANDHLAHERFAQALKESLEALKAMPGSQDAMSTHARALLGLGHSTIAAWQA